MKPAGRVRGSAGLAVALSMTLAIGVSPIRAATAGDPGTAASAGTSADAPGSCPATLAETDIDAGMVGTGWTVTTGDHPRPFRVKILGTLQDGIAPGRDLIIIKVSDLPGQHVISQGNGIWAGMSGSPVYLGGKLAGAVSYGFSTGPSHIGGMTPARQMQRISTYSSTSGVTRSVVLSAPLKRAVAKEAGVSTAGVPSLRQLEVPFVISAPRGRIRDQLASQLRRVFGSIKVLSGSTTAGTASSDLAAPPVAGGNLAGVISSGDVTIAAVGTTTSVCGATVLGFGHPMTGAGRVSFGAARASAITIVDDPAGTPFKMANIGRLFGVLDQDRIAGIRATVGRAPRNIDITARVRSTDTGDIRTGHSSVTTSSWVPIVAANHLLYDIFTTADDQGAGTALLSWTIRGTRPDGQHWSLVRSDRVASTDVVGLDAGQLLLDQLSTIDQASLEKVKFDSVTISATVSPVVKVYVIQGVQVSRNGGPWKQRDSITAHPGDSLRFLVKMHVLHGGTATKVVGLSVPVTASGAGTVTVGIDPFGSGSACTFDPSACPATFPGLIKALRDAPRNDDLQVSLDLSDLDGKEVLVTRSTRLAKVVEGTIQLPIEIR